MRYVKKQNDTVVEAQIPPFKGKDYYLNLGYIEYEGTLPVNRLDVVDRVVVELPEEPIDTSAFDSACTLFKDVCNKIGTAIGSSEFKGGFDEYTVFINSQFFKDNPADASLLASMWSGANEYAKYEGQKLGYGQPEWWYKCWGIEQPSGEPLPEV